MGLFELLIFGPLTLLLFALAILPFAFWVWMLIDCLSKEPSEGNDKIIWGIIIFFGNFIGAILYYFVRRPERIEQYGE
jgi:Phospholipase_D-nuclease N-terminal